MCDTCSCVWLFVRVCDGVEVVMFIPVLKTAMKSSSCSNPVMDVTVAIFLQFPNANKSKRKTALLQAHSHNRHTQVAVNERE